MGYMLLETPILKSHFRPTQLPHRQYTGSAPALHWFCTSPTLALHQSYTGPAPAINWLCTSPAQAFVTRTLDALANAAHTGQCCTGAAPANGTPAQHQPMLRIPDNGAPEGNGSWSQMAPQQQNQQQQHLCYSAIIQLWLERRQKQFYTHKFSYSFITAFIYTFI